MVESTCQSLLGAMAQAAQGADLSDLAGWLPAVILPLSTTIQLVKLLREKSGAGTSTWTWSLFAIANFGAYAFTGRYAAVQSILAFLVTGLLDVAIVAALLVFGRRDASARPRRAGGDLP